MLSFVKDEPDSPDAAERLVRMGIDAGISRIDDEVSAKLQSKKLLEILFQLIFQDKLKLLRAAISKPFMLSATAAVLGIPASVNLQSSTGDTPLHFACEAGHLDCFKVLVEVGANVNIVNHVRWSESRVFFST